MQKFNVAMLTHNDPGAFQVLDMLFESPFIGKVAVVDDWSEFDYWNRLVRYELYALERRKLDGNFSDQRNFCINQLPKDGWVMTIDPDELLSDGYLQAVSDAIESQPDCDAVKVWRRNIVTFPDGSTPHQRTEQSIRFFRHNGRIRYVGPIHEGIEGITNTAEVSDSVWIIHEKTNERCSEQHRAYDAGWYSKGIGV